MFDRVAMLGKSEKGVAACPALYFPHPMLRCILVILAGLAAGVLAQSPRTLDIYWIDTEGGASTLIVTPQGQSVLMDTGYTGLGDRDPARIEHVVKEEARLDHVDYVLTSHFHADHVGGLASVAKRVPIGAFLDHGESVELTAPGGKALWDAYLAVAGSKRHAAMPGERLPLRGVEFTIVAAHSKVLTTPLAGSAPNAQCATFKPQAEDAGENGKSLGYLLRAGDFEFADLGDLSWNFQRDLACPVNMLGVVDLMQVPHHGVRDDALPQLVWAMAPTVAVMNNGPAKGAGPEAIDAVLKSPGLQDLWSLHRLLANDAAHNATEPLTANLGPTDGCAGAWIRARVNGDGTFTVTNSCTNQSKMYRVK